MERTLVTYASKNGSTAEIAAVIADELRDAGVDTDLIEAAYVDDVTPYTTVVIDNGRLQADAAALNSERPQDAPL